MHLQSALPPARPPSRPPSSLIAAAALDGALHAPAKNEKPLGPDAGEEILAHMIVGTPCPGILMPFTCPREPHAPAHAKHHDTGNDRHSAREQPLVSPLTPPVLKTTRRMCSADPGTVRAHGNGHCRGPGRGDARDLCRLQEHQRKRRQRRAHAFVSAPSVTGSADTPVDPVAQKKKLSSEGGFPVNQEL